MKTFTQTHLLPDIAGNFWNYGGRYVPPTLEPILEEITQAYLALKDDPAFIHELATLHKHFTGRPSPVYHLKNMSQKLWGAQIYLKREDLNHTGAHKINHCLGEALLAKKMWKKKVIAETGAGQHGVALATAAALLGLECDIYMGEVDMVKEQPNVVRMQILGTRVIPVKSGLRSLKEAVDEAFFAYMADPVNIFYAIGSVVGPHPFPMMVRDFQSIVGIEARTQIQELTGELPDALVACVGWGSNAIGLFSAFLDDESVKMYGVEPAGSGLGFGQHAATLTLGKPGLIHGFKCHVLTDEVGNPAPVHTIASGLDYPGVGPEHSYLHDIGRVQYRTIGDDGAIEAFRTLARTEGIIPAIESAHALAYAMELAPTLPQDTVILVNLSGRWDKDIDFVMEKYWDRFAF